ncbi:MAG: dTDP-4-dehydrorhamnose reductase [Rhizobiales bacterium]|nr:dTDP-4-dehydrorhamnose reductase [Hyphomicrobiales bacterium]
MRILVTGREGQVVNSLLDSVRRRHPDIEIMPLGRPWLDLQQTDMIYSRIEAARPDAVVSAAAYTAVDLAESEPDKAERVNGFAPGEIGRAARALGVPVVHLSTDYVFDGRKPHPYRESDPVAPLGVYGRTKLAGERMLAAMNDNHAILRTAWVYSPFGKNFVKTMLRLGLERDRISVVSDQIGNPTSALDIAETIIQVTRNLLADDDARLRGVFHMTGEGEASWAEFAQEIFSVWRKMNGRVAEVEPIPTSAYPTPAARPANSRLDCARLADVHRIRMPHWRESLDEVMRAF